MPDRTDRRARRLASVGRLFVGPRHGVVAWQASDTQTNTSARRAVNCVRSIQSVTLAVSGYEGPDNDAPQARRRQHPTDSRQGLCSVEISPVNTSINRDQALNASCYFYHFVRRESPSALLHLDHRSARLLLQAN
ncbi:hypothetical protein J6590_034112 [Homalodisca vitripennis]|nr:hypothetical protein J6590_034112 [Homalodisca vitripennis]